MSSPYSPGYEQSYYLSPKINFNWISEAWSIVISGLGSWIFLYLLAGGVLLAFGIVLDVITPGGLDSARAGHGATTTSDDIVMLIFYPLALIVMTLISACSADMAVRQVRGEPIGTQGMFRGARYFFPILGFQLLFGLACVTGIVALCFGMFAVMAFMMPAWALIGDGEPVFSAISKSLNGMKRDWLNATLFAFVFYLIMYIGTAVTCNLGILVLYPMYFVISALAYRDMVGMPNMGYSQTAQTSDQSTSGAGVWPPPPSSGQTGAWPPQPQQPSWPPQPQQPSWPQSPPPSQGFGQPNPNQDDDKDAPDIRP